MLIYDQATWSNPANYVSDCIIGQNVSLNKTLLCIALVGKGIQNNMLFIKTAD